MNKLKDWLVRACSEVGLRIETEFLWVADDGRKFHPVARIPDIGATNGMLVFLDYDEIRLYADKIVQAGYGYSVLDQPRPDETFDLDSFREMFTDWGRNVGN
jgi:hypothetical protein